MNKMKLYTIIGAGLFALTSTALFACSEIEDGSNDMSSWPEVKDYVTTLEHPCMLHTETDFEFVKGKVQSGAQPWKNAFDHLTRGGNNLSQSAYKASPVKLLARLDQNNWAGKYPNDWNNYTKLMRDAAAAYQLALRWKLSETDGTQYADAAIAILNDWAKTCAGFIVNDKGEFIDPNEFLIFIQVHQIANAAEIMRSYSGWQEADFAKFKSWIADVFYPHITKFLSTHNGNECALHYWLNWDLSAMTALLSIGILTDDNFKINEAIQYFKFGIGSGNIGNGVPFTHLDPDSNEMLGQCQESGRDQGHATLCVSLLGAFCQMAKNVGEDL
ncbi:alginate lyase family protein, partial [Bacteroides acidifaciens]